MSQWKRSLWSMTQLCHFKNKIPLGLSVTGILAQLIDPQYASFLDSPKILNVLDNTTF